MDDAVPVLFAQHSKRDSLDHILTHLRQSGSILQHLGLLGSSINSIIIISKGEHAEHRLFAHLFALCDPSLLGDQQSWTSCWDSDWYSLSSCHVEGSLLTAVGCAIRITGEVKSRSVSQGSGPFGGFWWDRYL